MSSRRMSPRDESGTAIIEFVWLAILLLIPLLYVVLAVFDTQRTSYAASSAARSAGFQAKGPSPTGARPPPTAETQPSAAACAGPTGSRSQVSGRAVGRTSLTSIRSSSRIVTLSSRSAQRAL